eukprot:2483940-Prymnesium_polylepis.1
MSGEPQTSGHGPFSQNSYSGYLHLALLKGLFKVLRTYLPANGIAALLLSSPPPRSDSCGAAHTPPRRAPQSNSPLASAPRTRCPTRRGGTPSSGRRTT